MPHLAPKVHEVNDRIRRLSLTRGALDDHSMHPRSLPAGRSLSSRVGSENPPAPANEYIEERQYH